jgi:hypothetical protein
MATRKKKETSNLTVPDALGAVKIEVGSHLTVKTFADGRRELTWDDEALMRDVRAAILKAESTVPAAAKPARVARKTAKK